MSNGWFTMGSVSFLAEQARKDGKGTFLTIYVRFGTEKAEVRKAKVWSQSYMAEDGAFYLRDVSGEWAVVELGSELTAYGTESIYKLEGNERVSYVLTETAGLKLRSDVSVQA
jgi:hypothetical protein